MINEMRLPPLLIYLDQNKWIELARIVYGKDAKLESKVVLERIRAAIASGRWVLPLSAVHYMELARISNRERRHRLGAVMHEFSGGLTIAPVREIIEHEIEIALVSRRPALAVTPFSLLGRGVAHAFGVDIPVSGGQVSREQFERSVLAGDASLNLDSPVQRESEHREHFQRHLQGLKEIRDRLAPALWEDALHAITMIDIIDPLNRVFGRHGLDKTMLFSLGKAGITGWLQSLPSRQVDLHLHRQVLKDLHYRPKLTDLEDWAGLIIASVYCDVLVCEKHMAAMLRRDGFRSSALIEQRLTDMVHAADSIAG